MKEKDFNQTLEQKTIDAINIKMADREQNRIGR